MVDETTESKHYVKVTVVWLASLLLVGGPTLLFVNAGVSFAVDPFVDVELSNTVGLAVLVGTSAAALAVALTAAGVAARIRLHGWEELQEGTRRRRAVRHLVLAIPAVGLVVFLGYAIFEIAVDSYGHPTPVILGVLAVLAAGFGLLLVLTVRAFLDGRRSAGHSEG